MKNFLFLFVFLFLAADVSHGAPLMYRQQQMKAQKERQQQMEALQYQEYLQHGAQSQNQNAAAATQTYDQQIEARNQQIAQAIRGANNGNASTDNLQAHPQKPNSSAAVPSVVPPGGTADVKEVADLAEVWKKLDTKSAVWNLLIDDQAKLLTVTEYINRYTQQGVKINQSAAHYVQLIDQLVTQNPSMLQRPFGEVLQVLAIIDYDFDNGMDKDVLARKILGDAGFQQNKDRFTRQSQAPPQ